MGFLVEAKGLLCQNDNTLPVILKKLFATEESLLYRNDNTLPVILKKLFATEESISLGMTKRFLVGAKGASLSE